jgi:hypothetical protein
MAVGVRPELNRQETLKVCTAPEYSHLNEEGGFHLKPARYL